MILCMKERRVIELGKVVFWFDHGALRELSLESLD